MHQYKKNQRKRQQRRPRLPRIDSQGTPINPTTGGFATAMAAEAFGYRRHFAWRQWREFQDTTPDELARRRAA